MRGTFRTKIGIAGLLTGIPLILFYFFEVSFPQFIKNFNSILALGLISLALFFFNYWLIGFLFRFFIKKEIQHIAQQFPQYFISGGENPTSFPELEEKIRGIHEDVEAKVAAFQQMDQYRRDYLGNVSHELKTPLFSLRGFAETLLDGGVEDLSIRDKYLERISQSTERILNIVEDLSMINRLESGQVRLVYSSFDINVLIYEVFDMLDLEVQQGKVTFDFVTSSSKIGVYADRNKISQIFINLFSNAISYSKDDKVNIKVETKAVGSEVQITVADNGMGIKPENINRIFERFYRVEASRNRKKGGSGLGLSIVKHILEAHHKNIKVKSVYTQGTEFSFTLDIFS